MKKLNDIAGETSLELAQKCRSDLGKVFERIDDIALENQAKVLSGFRKYKVGLTDLWPSTGYGYQDRGRDVLDQVFAYVMGAESALVRSHFVSGTHAIKTALFSLVSPGKQVLSLTGIPYDTMHPVLGISSGKDRSPWSLAGIGVTFAHTDCLVLFEEGRINRDELTAAISAHVTPQTCAFFIQRSRGYSCRKSISTRTMEIVSEILERNFPGIPSLVDNCYCEFAGTVEPPALGFTLTAGSLIKNPGGGIAPTGGYIAGKTEYVDRAAEVLFAPGIGREVGSNPDGYRPYFQGLFLAPKITAEALKGMAFASAFFSAQGYEVDPGPFDERSDIVQTLVLRSPDRLKAFARAIQAASPVDSYVTPEPWDMPGYDHQVIMAAGTFVQGSSIELSCDAPFVEPYVAYLQGGLTLEHVIIACMLARDYMSCAV